MSKPPADAVSVLPERTRRRWSREEARTVVAACDSSGLSVKKFAAREGLKPERVSRWKQALRTVKPSPTPPFVELRQTSARSSRDRIEIVLRSGHILFVGESVNPSSLRRIVELLERDTEC
jgi:transposase-like protein